MTFKPITTNLLRKAAEDAQKRDQYGLVIWPSETNWRSLHRFVNYTNPLIPQIGNVLLNREGLCWVSFSKQEVSLEPQSGYALAVSTHQVLASKQYLMKVFKNCPQGVGVPITTLPATILSAVHLNPCIF